MNQNSEQFKFIEQILKIHLSKNIDIQNIEFFYGGNFNTASKVSANGSDYFVKWAPEEDVNTFEKEAKNLQLIDSTNTLKVPKVYGNGNFESKNYLIIQGISSAEQNKNYWKDFGIGLANLHKTSSPNGFGLDYDNFIGTLPQINSWNKNWIDFFIENRLIPQLDLAEYNRKINSDLIEKFEALFKELNSIFPENSSSLIHGDLWDSNIMTDLDGNAIILDPTCYFGSREAEIAFTTMFGGFENEFYESYNEVLPIEKGFHERLPFYNLYPLLVHVNLFGEGYLPTINKILSKF
ncbi:MAG: hypothetical protein RIR51_1850 [Bacteroidota bacterium]